MADVLTYEDEYEEEPALIVEDLISAGNFADQLGDEKLAEISSDVLRGYEIDCASRRDWLDSYEAAKEALRTAKEAKNFPFEDASNVRYPLMLQAVVQFGARASRGLIRGGAIVSTKVVGEDPQQQKEQRAGRVAKFMNEDLLGRRSNWKSENAKLLYHLPQSGHAFKKVCWDFEKNKRSSEFVRADQVVVNQATQSLDECPRITYPFDCYPHKIEERIRSGRYREADGWRKESGDDHEPHELLECYVRLDLDEDGYPEPYIVTVHKDSGAVFSIFANFREVERREESRPVGAGHDGMPVVEISAHEVKRIEARDYWVDYVFLPDPQGGYYGVGLGQLLETPQASIDTVLNQLIDAGTLANAGGGFIGRGLSFKQKGPIRFEPGEYKPVNADGPTIKDSIVPLTFPGPNPALFNVLGLLIEAGEKAANSSDVLTGDMPRNQPASTTMALIEQGLTVFSDISERVLDGLQRELDILVELYAENLSAEDYNRVMDFGPEDAGATPQQDFDTKSMDIRPVADPRSMTDMQRVARAQLLQEDIMLPWVNGQEVTRRKWEAANVEDIDALFIQPKPDPKLMLETVKLANEGTKLKLEAIKVLTQSINELAQAEAAEPGQQLDQLTQRVVLLQKLTELMNGGQPGSGGGQGGIPGVVGQPPGSAAPQGAPGLPVPGGGPPDPTGALNGGVNQPFGT